MMLVKLNESIFSQLIKKLQKELEKELPGIAAHLIMAPKMRLPSTYTLENAVKSSVLILLYLKNEIIHFVLIERTKDHSVHSRQISFPGGRYENTDKNLINTAIRETYEEIGVESNEFKVIGQLSEIYIPPSNYLVLPVLAFSTKKINFKPSPHEVNKIIEIYLDDLLNPNNCTNSIFNKTIEAPCYNLNKKLVWGATAMILSEFSMILKRCI